MGDRKHLPVPQGMGARLRRVREEKCLTQKELGDLAHVSETTIGQIERGGDARASTLLSLAGALGVSAGWLSFGG